MAHLYSSRLFTYLYAGSSLVFTYLATLWGAGAGVVYVAAKAAHNARLEGGARRRPQYIRHGRGGMGGGFGRPAHGGFGQRPHYQ